MGILTVLYLVAQMSLALAILYLSISVLFIMYTLSPLYRDKVPYVPTRKKFMKKGFDLLAITTKDNVIDLGSGDGQFVLYGASKVGAEFTGIEYNRILYTISCMKSRVSRKKGKVSLIRGDYFKENLRKYTKVFLFSMPTELAKLVPKLEAELAKGTRVLSVMFPLVSKRFTCISSTEGSYRVYLYERV